MDESLNSVDTAEVNEWAVKYLDLDSAWVYAKRLSANDTQANGSHQAGPYLPKAVLFGMYPEIFKDSELNPKHQLVLHLDSHSRIIEPVLTWYNSKLFGRTRNEARLTSLGGSEFPILDPNSTGSLLIMVFVDGQTIRAWLCRNTYEEDALTEFIGPVEPGETLVIKDDGLLSVSSARRAQPLCLITSDSLPSTWYSEFPSPTEIIEEAFSRLSKSIESNADKRLIERRECESRLFYAVEDFHELPKITLGYTSIQAFIQHASSVLQRRKARSGRSLEMHIHRILTESGLTPGINFVHQATTEARKKPDFLFPNAAAYQDPAFPPDRLFMLAAKTTCKDRWRQIINEADRIPVKHLVTLQEGVSEHQLAEMESERVVLVVPEPLKSKYPSSVRHRLLGLEEFIQLVAHQ